MKAVVTVLILTCSFATGQVTWYVDVSATGSGTGTQADPFESIQAGINAAWTGDTVLVLPGTYMENLVVIGKCIDIVSTGGPAITTIDGNQAGSVVTFYNTPAVGGRLEGFTITNGRGVDGATGATLPVSYGCTAVPLASPGAAGGINCAFASPVIRSCVVANNVGGRGGAGGFCLAYASHGYTSFSPGPGARGGPGGILLSESMSRIERCVIEGNTGGDGGSGRTGFVPVSFSGNGRDVDSSGGPGGAGGLLSTSNGLAPVVVGCVVANNQGGAGGDAGQGICSPYGCPSAAGSAGGTGGCEFTSQPVQVVSSTVVFNSGGAGGLGSMQPIGPAGVGGVRGAFFANGIAWANTPSNVQSNVLASNIGAIDPQFVDAANGDYHLLPSSPCVDAGSNLAQNLPAVDMDGDPRVFHGTVDQGADETILSQVPSQPGPGTPVSFTNYNLTPGNQYYNLFTFGPCGATGVQLPQLGICGDLNALLSQFNSPLGTPFHFIANADSMTWGPYQLPPATVEGVCFEWVGGSLGFVSRPVQFVIQ